MKEQPYLYLVILLKEFQISPPLEQTYVLPRLEPERRNHRCCCYHRHCRHYHCISPIPDTDEKRRRTEELTNQEGVHGSGRSPYFFHSPLNICKAWFSTQEKPHRS
ncbi:hypothetical protein NE237_019170 [Protea cynaroides]|uniref:Uncharacterized protein n=1 Tax=Protea cynaroides TaxID=273540 RepID=A0A9Q0KBI1_9MAGN|nr:hypothetical protein NE237_019170 [Protea cynaroides]